MQQAWNRNEHFQYFLLTVIFEATVLWAHRTQMTCLYLVSSFCSVPRMIWDVQENKYCIECNSLKLTVLQNVCHF